MERFWGRGGDYSQTPLFTLEEENPPRERAIEFYQHKHNWKNRLIAGDSLLVMNSMLEREGLGGEVQMVYMDPPFGIKYGSNFQPYTNQAEATDGRDSDLTTEPEMLRAFRDTWELGIHSYLSCLRNRLLLAKDLLKESGSCFVQIGKENVHRVALVLDEVFGAENRVATISFPTTGATSAKFLPEVTQNILWYAKNKNYLKYRQIYEKLNRDEILNLFTSYAALELKNGTSRRLSKQESENLDLLPEGAKLFRTFSLTSQGSGRSDPYIWEGREYFCPSYAHWSVSKCGLNRLAEIGRLFCFSSTSSLSWKFYEHEVPGRKISNHWGSVTSAKNKRYVVETAPRVLERCILMATDPGDIVFDPTCGSGTTAFVAEQWGRRWVTCDTSRVALNLARQRLMTATYDYYKLAHPDEGVGSGFEYETVPKVSAAILGYDQKPPPITLYDRPLKNRKKFRITGPFTVEAVPAPTVLPIDDGLPENAVPRQAKDDGQFPTDGLNFEIEADDSAARSGETSRQLAWREELFATGINTKQGSRLRFTRLDPVPGVWRHLHAEGETPAENGQPQRIVISFGPAHAPLEQRQVELALKEANQISPNPDLVVFAAFQFDSEAAKDIDEHNSPSQTILKAQMNSDLFTADLKGKRSSNESFWLVGQPDVELARIDDVKFKVIVKGFDYFNVRNGQLQSGGPDEIALWMLDSNYDGRSLLPSQVFFPMDGSKGGWKKLAKNLRASIDQELIKAYQGTESLPFEAGEFQRAAVKIVDNRGVESLRILKLP